MPKSEETKTARKAATDYAADNLSKKVMDSRPVAFTLIKASEFNQLLDRIEHPHLINQGRTEFCGPAAVLHALAKDDPISYAKLAVGLFREGKITVRGWTVDAGLLTTQQVPKDMEIDCCDWITMASIRTNIGFGSALSSVTTLVSGTLPWEIEQGLTSLGYAKVIDETSSTRFAKVDEANLARASDLWTLQYRVILCINDNLFKDPNGTSWKPNHFCTLKSKVEMTDHINCRVWQWGLSKKGTRHC
ncbi:MAG: hypothetical protein WA324_12550 [Bryobacteraceae bacterium]